MRLIARIAAGIAVMSLGAGVAIAAVSPDATYSGALTNDPKALVSVTVNVSADGIHVYFTALKLHCEKRSDNFRSDYSDDLPLNPDNSFAQKTTISGGVLVIQGHLTGKKAVGTVKATFTGDSCTSRVQDWVANAN